MESNQLPWGILTNYCFEEYLGLTSFISPYLARCFPWKIVGKVELHNLQRHHGSPSPASDGWTNRLGDCRFEFEHIWNNLKYYQYNQLCTRSSCPICLHGKFISAFSKNGTWCQFLAWEKLGCSQLTRSWQTNTRHFEQWRAGVCHRQIGLPVSGWGPQDS